MRENATKVCGNTLDRKGPIAGGQGRSDMDQLDYAEAWAACSVVLLAVLFVSIFAARVAAVTP